MDCRICGNQEANVEYLASEKMNGTGESFPYFQCARCDCLQIADYPANIAHYYGPDYYSYAKAQTPTDPFSRWKARTRDRYELTRRGHLGRYFSERGRNVLLSTLAPALRDRRESVLEIGCGSGALLRTLHGLGYQSLTGADPFIASDVHVARNFVIHKKELCAITGTFDVILLNHSLEHLPFQHDVFRQIADHLSPSGRCVIRVPVSTSFAWAHYGVNWVQLDAPRHFYLHSEKSLNLLAAEVGMQLDDTTFDSNMFQFWGSEQYERGVPLRDPRSLAQCSVADSIFTRDQMSEFRQRARELNDSGRGDQAAFFFSSRS